MSSIVTGILSSTVGLLLNKARDKTAAKLKDGDVTDARIRELVVRELNDVKTKLDGLSRKDLLSSYSFLKEGIDLLNASLDKSMDEQEEVLDETRDDQGETLGMSSGVESGILNEALKLSRTMEKLKIVSEGQFECAKKRFEDARRSATYAFSNEALSIHDRLMAAKLRIVATILECLESPETAIVACLSFLKELHGLKTICEMFCVYLDGGVKSMLNKAERVENVKSVMLVNYVLLQLFSKFSKKDYSYLDWPVIELNDRCFQPILHWQEVSKRKSMGEELTQHPNGLLLDEDIRLHNIKITNNLGEIVVWSFIDIHAISTTGQIKVVKLPDSEEIIKRYIAGLAVDNSNNVYVIAWLNKKNVVSYVLYVLGENYNVKHECALDFLAPSFSSARIAINKNNDIIMTKDDVYPRVYICDDTGQLKHKFELFSVGEVRSSSVLSVTAKNEIMIPRDDDKAVEIYTEEGNLKSTIKVPEGYEVRGSAFHYVICKIIILTYNLKEDSYFLLCYSETGKLETSTFLLKKNNVSRFANITSHPSGLVAVASTRSITYI